MRALGRLWGGRGQEEPASGTVAKERLRLVLAHDRTSISPALLETLKDEIIAVISKHVPIDAGAVEVSFSQNARETRLVADIPVLSRSRQR